MKVCIYTGITPSTTFINRLIIGLADSGVSVLLHGNNHKGYKQFLTHPNITVIGYSGKWSKLMVSLRYLCLLFFLRPNAFKTIRKELKMHKGFSARFNFWLKAAPIVWYKPDIFHLQWVKWLDYWIWLQHLDIKVVTSLRGSQINIEPLTNTSLKKMYADLFPKVDCFHAVSDAIGNRAVLYGASRNRIQTIYTGLRLPEFPFNPTSLPSPDSELQLISIGRDHWVKGYTYAIDAMVLLKQRGVRFHYTIIGGLCEEHLFHINELSISDHITLTGNIPFEVVQQKLQHTHLLILPSLEEGIANVVPEAMALGIPVISTSVGGMPEIITDSQTGWLIPPQHADALANAVENYLQTTPEHLSGILTAARQVIENRFSEQKMVVDMKNLYRQTIASNL